LFADGISSAPSRDHGRHQNRVRIGVCPPACPRERKVKVCNRSVARYSLGFLFAGYFTRRFRPSRCCGFGRRPWAGSRKISPHPWRDQQISAQGNGHRAGPSVDSRGPRNWASSILLAIEFPEGAGICGNQGESRILRDDETPANVERADRLPISGQNLRITEISRH